MKCEGGGFLKENNNLSFSDLEDSTILRENETILSLLLKDHTTGKNIKWGTDSYINHGYSFRDDQEIKIDLITGWYDGFIRSRAEKNSDIRLERQRSRAEVFTASWVIKLQVDAALEDMRNLSLSDFIQTKWLEITCGEAPYMVNRYDMDTGKIVPLDKRAGFMDVKFRRLNQEVEDQYEWIELATEIYKASYGYEYQGDSLLLARENLILTFIDNYFYMFGAFPDDVLIMDIAKIVSANVFQMDGLNYEVPYSYGGAEEFDIQLNLFAELEETEGEIPQFAKIKLWNQEKIIEFKEISERNEPNMKFDVVIGNPPFQEVTAKKETKNGQKTVTNIFQYFQINADNIAKESSCLIYPGGRWIHRSGKGMKKFGLKQINDPHLSRIIYFPADFPVFEGVDIYDGVSIVLKKFNQEQTTFKYEYISKDENKELLVEHPGKNILPLNPNDTIISKKIDDFVSEYKLSYLHDSIYPRNLFGIESNFVEQNLDKVELYKGGSFDKDKFVKLFSNDKAGKGGRARWYLTTMDSIPKNKEIVKKWKVIVSSANAGGQKRDNQLEVVDNYTAFGRSRIALSSFDTEEEANNFYKYAKSNLIQYAFTLTDENLSSLGRRVPHLNSYSNKNELINFNEEIDKQLYDLIGLEENEINQIEKIVSELPGNKKEME